ncbi:MAG TPA: glycosyltransferase [Rhizomicrobium sp.]|nr:glycosyltransferase [Rhizomicrobium sp.]
MSVEAGTDSVEAVTADSVSDPRERRAAADHLYEKGAFEDARDAYLKLAASHIDTSWSQYQLGRIAAREKDWTEALARFDASTADKKPFAWAHYEKARLLKKRNAPVGDVTRELVGLIAKSPKNFNDDHYTFLLSYADAAAKEDLLDDAETIYEWLAQRGKTGYAANLRRADLQLKKKCPREALSIVEELAAAPEYDQRGAIVKARTLLALDRSEEAVEILLPIVSRAPGNINFVRMLFNALERSGDRVRLRKAEDFLRGIPEEQRFEFRLKARATCGDYAGVAETLRTLSREGSAPHLLMVVRAMNAAILEQNFAAAAALFDAAGGIDRASPKLVSARVRSLFLQSDLKSAGELLAEADRVIGESDDPELQLRRFEYLCLTMQHEKAKAFLEAWRAAGDIPPNASTAAASLYASLGQWNDVLALFDDCIGKDFDIANEAFLEGVARAARRTGRYAEVVAGLDRVIAQSPEDMLMNFRDRLMAEMSLVASLGLPQPSGGGAESISSPLYAHRAKLFSDALSESADYEGTKNVYFCSDSNYLAGTCVALFTMLRSNLSLRNNATVSVICSDSVFDFAGEICERIGAAFSVKVHMRPASSLLGEARNFKSGWGLFTPGHGLSDAAYYRIFMARKLLEEGVTGRALYIDSDTCIAHGIEEVLNFDLHGQPLGARREADLPEIRQAALRLGVEPEKYFNSGVLLFDLSHPELSAALDHAVQISLERHEMLTFVDQCALNVAFQGRYTPLPDAFNWFLRQSFEANVLVQEPTILHFLARPKPWDPMYSAVHCMRWVREFAMLGDVITPEMAKRLLAVQYARA